VTVTGCAAEGRVNVTDATPEEFVVAITLEPLLMPFDRLPALVLKNMVAPLAAERFSKNGENWVLRHCRQKDGRDRGIKLRLDISSPAILVSSREVM
jgi:hypothetical protein